MQRHCRLKVSLATAFCFAALGPISAAVADDGSPPPTVPDDVAAAAQYRESVPTASGKVSSAAVHGGPGTLTPRVRAAITAQGGRDQKLLKSIGGSAGRRVSDNAPQRSADGFTVRQPGAVGAALGTPAWSPGMIALLIVLVGGTLFTAFVARHERAEHRVH